jgi:PAS domain S-box-containing protein
MTAKELRSKAEDAMRTTRSDIAALSKHDVQRLVHELQVHQIELEMQNESLRHAQEELEGSQQRYRELFDRAPAGYLTLDEAGAVVRANAAAIAMLGLSHAQLIGQPLIAFVVDEHVTRLREHLRHARTNARVTCLLQLRAVSGVTLHVRLDISSVSSLAGGCFVVLTDVTERQRSFEALRQLNDELEARVAARTAELAARNMQLESELQSKVRMEAQRRDLEDRLRDAQRLESLSLLAGGLAHDFNNLLVSVLGNAELLLLRAGLPEDWREPLTRIKRAGRAASDLTRQLLVFAGRGKLNTCAVSVPHVVAESIEQLRPRLVGGVQLRTQITVAVPSIEADRGQIQQVVTSLVTNAMEAVGERGVIVIETRAEQLDAERLNQFQHRLGAEPGLYTMLRVQDSGSGIDPASMSRIFDPFFTTKFTGRGLGLATVLGVVQGHRGALRVQSTPGEGTSFELAFPASEVVKESEHPQPIRETEWVGSGHVLLIDDDDDVRAVVARLLTSLGFEVTSASGGEKGLEYFRCSEQGFDLVVLDWLMPGVSGEQVLKELRALDPELPVVLISGYSAEDLATADERLVRVQKPMTLAQLREAVRMVLSASKAAVASTILA